jgi:hypothetical protein
MPVRIEGEQLKDVVVSLARRWTWSPVADAAEVVLMRPADMASSRNPTEARRYLCHVPVEEPGMRVEVDEAENE